MDPIKLQAVLNKKPREVVTASEWNEILTLLVTQANEFADRLIGFNTTIEGLLNGEIGDVTVNTNVTQFGGKTPDEYTLDTELATAIQNLQDSLTTLINQKQNKIYITPQRIISSDNAGAPVDSTILVSNLTGLTSNVQTQLNSKSASTHTHTEYSSTTHTHTWVQSAGNSDLVDGKHVFVQTSQPVPNSVGDIWIAY